MKTRNGKISCILGLAAFLLMILAKYSFEHTVADLSYPLISPVINKIISPLNYLDPVYRNRIITEPSITRLPLYYLLEEDAALIIIIISLLLVVPTLYYVYKSITNHEENIWYANGVNFVVLTFLVFEFWVGALTAIIIMYQYFNYRRKLIKNYS